MATLERAAGHTISQRCLLLSWVPGVVHILASADRPRIISPHTPRAVFQQTDPSVGPECAGLVQASGRQFLFLSIVLSLSPFVQTLLSFTDSSALTARPPLGAAFSSLTSHPRSLALLLWEALHFIH